MTNYRYLPRMNFKTIDGMNYKHKISQYDRFLIEYIKEKIKKHIDDRVIDLGCGTRDCVFKNDKKVTLFGLDLSYANIALNSDIQYKTVGSVEKLPFGCTCAKCVVMFDVVEHINNPKLCLQEIHRCLRKNGSLIIFTPNLFGASGISYIGKLLPLNLRALLLKALGKKPSSSPYPLFYKLNSISSIRKMARSLHFCLQEVYFIPCIPHWFHGSRLLSFLFHLYSSIIIYGLKLPQFSEKLCFILSKEEYETDCPEFQNR